MHPIRKRVLFVDDEAAIRKTPPPIFGRYGFMVTTAATVKEALGLVRINEYDLLLCDLNIEQVGDGFKVVRAIRQANPRCVVIILTAFPGLESAVEGIRESVDDYITKPANADELVAILSSRQRTNGIQ